MSKSVNTSACPFQGYVPKYWPLRPHRCGMDHGGLPLTSQGLMLQPDSPPTSLHSKGHGGHKICYLRKTWWIPEAGQAQANYTPGETRHICSTPLGWHSVLSWGTGKDPLMTAPWTNRCFWRFIIPGCIQSCHTALVYECERNEVSSCSGNIKTNSLRLLICEKSSAVWLQTSKEEDAGQVFT